MKTVYLKTDREKIYCKMYKTRRAKKMTLSVGSAGNVTLTLPRWGSYKSALDFLKQKKSWVLDQVGDVKGREAMSIMQVGTRSDYLKNKERARTFVARRLAELNSFYGFKYERVSIRDQKSRWGSCSEKGNLNFNYRIIFLEPELADYLMVHELCHLGQMNHSRKFWELVEKTIPNYKEIAKSLRNI